MQVEIFKDGILILDLVKSNFVVINSTQEWILRNLDGQQTINRLAHLYKNDFSVSFKIAHNVIYKNYLDLCQKRILTGEKLSANEFSKTTMRFLQNPNIKIRDQDQMSAVLYNSESDRLELLNSIGFRIWKLCIVPKTIAEIINAFKNDFKNVPERMTDDIIVFIRSMTKTGFLFTIET